MRSLYEASGLGRIALGLQAWPRTVLRGNARASDSDAENKSLFAALKLVGNSGPERQAGIRRRHSLKLRRPASQG